MGLELLNLNGQEGKIDLVGLICLLLPIDKAIKLPRAVLYAARFR